MTLGLTLSIAIALHNIPEGISIALPIYYGSNSKLKALFYTLASGISELFGAIIAEIVLSPFITNNTLAFLYLIIAGMMIYIPLNNLIPTSKKYNNGVYNLKYILIGSLIMILNHILFN